jgi:hypothetical protein
MKTWPGKAACCCQDVVCRKKEREPREEKGKREKKKEKGRKINLRKFSTLILGGGGITLKDNLRRLLKNIFSKN